MPFADQYKGIDFRKLKPPRPPRKKKLVSFKPLFEIKKTKKTR